MSQEAINILQLFIAPILIGAIVQLAATRNKKASNVLMIAAIVLAAAAWACALLIYTHGNEALGLIAIMFSMLAAGSAAVFAVRAIIRKIKSR